MVPVTVWGSGRASVEDCCRSVLFLEDSCIVTTPLVIILKTEVTSLSVTTPLGEGMGIRGAPLLRDGGIDEVLFAVVTSDLLNKVVSKAVVFPKVCVFFWDSSVLPRRLVSGWRATVLTILLGSCSEEAVKAKEESAVVGDGYMLKPEL